MTTIRRKRDIRKKKLYNNSIAIITKRFKEARGMGANYDDTIH